MTDDSPLADDDLSGDTEPNSDRATRATDGEHPETPPSEEIRPGIGESETSVGETGASEKLADEGIYLPEYNVLEYFPERPTFSKTGLAEMREEYGLVRTYFMSKPGKHRELQQWINQSRMGVSYDRYLEVTAYYSFATAALGILLGGVVALLLARAGVLGAVQAPIDTSLLPDAVVDPVAGVKEALLSAVIVLVMGALLGSGTWFARYYRPRQVASGRKREIDFVLPSAIVFMYALSRSGMTLIDVIERIADADETYGEIALEFETIRRDIELFGNDVYTAIRNASALTPSDNFEQFLNDMVTLLDSGGEVTDFFREESRNYLRNARDEQAEFLDVLAILSEVFIVAFVAAPLFLIVILMVISLLGGSFITQMAALIYLGLPLGLAGFAVLLSTLSEPFSQSATQIELDDEQSLRPDETVSEETRTDPDFEEYHRHERWIKLRNRLLNPDASFRDRPLLTLALTVPVVLLLWTVGITNGWIPLTVDKWVSRPIQTTIVAVVFPLLVVAVPLSLFHELKRRRETEIVRRFPETLDIIASANSMGISLSDALEVVARWSTGRFARELRTVRNDIRWNNDTSAALIRFGNRLDVPELARTVNLIAAGRQATSDLSEVLNIAAEDARNRYKMTKERKQEMMSYLIVVIVGYFVFLGVIVLLNVSYLEPMSRLATASGSSSAATPDSPVGVTDIPVDTYRMLLFHATLVQGIGVGLISGLLADNSYLSGLKYSIGLSVLAVIVFTII